MEPSPIPLELSAVGGPFFGRLAMAMCWNDWGHLHTPFSMPSHNTANMRQNLIGRCCAFLI